jgi:hypothetical protein
MTLLGEAMADILVLLFSCNSIFLRNLDKLFLEKIRKRKETGNEL